MNSRLWGLILVVLGILVLLQVIEVYNFGLAFWPVVLLLIGFAILWESISRGYHFWFLLGLGLWVGGIGLFDILFNAGVTGLSGSDIARYGWPVILVAIGLSILIGNRRSFLGKYFIRNGSGRGKKSDHSQMRHIGDLYHGRSHWILDDDIDFYHGIGDVVIDLTTAEIKPGNHKIYVKTGIGEVTIRVPDRVNLNIDASVGLGELDVLGEQRSGIGGMALSRKVVVDDADASVNIEARMGLGELKVVYMPAVPGVSR